MFSDFSKEGMTDNQPTSFRYKQVKALQKQNK